MRKEKVEREKEWRRKRGEIESDEEDEENSQSGEESSEDEQQKADRLREQKRKEVAQKSTQPEDDEESDEEESEDEEPLIVIENPNRAPQKPKKDVNALVEEKVVLSRKDREQIEKQRAKELNAKLTAEGKTRQAREDLARLAIIKQKREEAAKKKATENKKAEAAAVSTSKSVAKK